jgi:hypothetical protein
MLAIQTMLAVNHFQDAERLIDGFMVLAERELGAVPSDVVRDLTAQKGYCLAQLGRARDTTALWRIVAAPEGAALEPQRAVQGTTSRSEPSPALSTP